MGQLFDLLAPKAFTDPYAYTGTLFSHAIASFGSGIAARATSAGAVDGGARGDLSLFDRTSQGLVR